ncbi:flagellar hook-length control protein FliK [Siculibacillus lacustris]|uniref:Flagellar hook-length control protein FliK n=1 Tax=Siculibacillus lacustris TaxID=1549641 RepID=A0A4Q9VED2_9HYPH|nr:flagellar hook-length control protein FliK [Siculibacillus lacustris]
MASEALPAAAALGADPAGPTARAAGEAAAGAAWGGAVDRSLRPPPPRRGQPTRGQPALPAESVDRAGGADDLGRQALERTDGALKRILLEQAAVLDRPADAAARVGPGRGEWTAELPIATAAGTGVMQMTVERDGGRDPTKAGEAAWRVRFSLDVEPVGPVHARIGLSGERMSIGLWIERPEMAARLAEDIGTLRGALEAAAIPVDGVHVAVGQPVAAKPAASAHFVDVSL